MSCSDAFLIEPSSVMCVEKDDGNIETLSMASTVTTIATSTASTSTNNSLSSSFSSYHSSTSSCASSSNRKSVSFVPTVDVVFIRHISEYTSTEVSELWTTNYERYTNKNESTATCQYMTKLGRNFLTQDEENATGYCSRGLEYRTMDGFKQRRQRKTNARVAVLYQQQQLGRGDTYDLTSSILSAVYQKHSIPCLDAAYQVALHDEQVARNINRIVGADTACSTSSSGNQNQQLLSTNINQHHRGSLGSTLTPAAA